MQDQELVLKSQIKISISSKTTHKRQKIGVLFTNFIKPCFFERIPVVANTFCSFGWSICGYFWQWETWNKDHRPTPNWNIFRRRIRGSATSSNDTTTLLLLTWWTWREFPPRCSPWSCPHPCRWCGSSQQRCHGTPISTNILYHTFTCQLHAN